MLDERDLAVAPTPRARDALLDAVVLAQRGADAHHQPALDLAQHALRVDRPPGVAGGHDAQHFDLAAPLVHRHLGRLGAVAKGKVHVASLPQVGRTAPDFGRAVGVDLHLSPGGIVRAPAQAGVLVGRSEAPGDFEIGGLGIGDWRIG